MAFLRATGTAHVPARSGRRRVERDRVCFRWTRVRFPDSGCYQLVQTAADQFTRRRVDQQRPISYSARE
jgi:hypothetical protein